MSETVSVREVEDAYIAVHDDDTGDVFTLPLFEDEDGKQYTGREMSDGFNVVPIELFMDAVDSAFIVYE